MPVKQNEKRKPTKILHFHFIKKYNIHSYQNISHVSLVIMHLTFSCICYSFLSQDLVVNSLLELLHISLYITV